MDALLTELPPERYGDPEDPLGGVLFWPPDPWCLVDESVDLDRDFVIPVVGIELQVGRAVLDE